MKVHMTWERRQDPAIKQMNALLRDRFILAANDLKLAYYVSDHVDECRASAKIALNTWYAFMEKYSLFRTDKAFYWARYVADE